MSHHYIIRATAVVACALVAAMVTIFVVTGTGQDGLQFVHPPAEYARLLLANPPALRATIALDNVFLVLYTTLFVSLGVVLVRHGADRALVRFWVALIVVVGMLDLVENVHFLVMLANAEQGAAPGRIEIGAQVIESLIKFHVSYLGLFVFGLALPRRTLAERVLAAWSVVQLPLGVLIYVTSAAIAVPLVFARFTYFVIALLLAARIYGRGGSDAPASFPDTTPRACG